MKLIIKFFCNVSPGTLNKYFGRLQLISAGLMAFSHGSNDAQKVMGVGATKRLSAVRWGIARKIVMAWILTLPVCAGVAWLVYKVMALIGYG